MSRCSSSVERPPRKRGVVGPTPTTGSNLEPRREETMRYKESKIAEVRT